MRAMVLENTGGPLLLYERDVPEPAAGQVLLRVQACAVCRTDLHVIDGDLANVRNPIVPGHEIVAEAVATGLGVTLPKGSRLGVPWLGYTCGSCGYCKRGQENPCDNARFTGYDLDRRRAAVRTAQVAGWGTFW